MRLGFTGTQGGVTTAQFDALVEQMKILSPMEAHHGDCEGADFVFHQICRDMGIPVILHPPIKIEKRAFCTDAAEVRGAKDYLVRNKDIVNESDHVIAVPPTQEELRRSGTWSTWRYANKAKVPTSLILPDGKIVLNFSGGPLDLGGFEPK